MRLAAVPIPSRGACYGFVPVFAKTGKTAPNSRHCPCESVFTIAGFTDKRLFIGIGNTETDMKRRRIRLTEGDLREMVKESVRSLMQNPLCRRGGLTEGRGASNILRDYRRVMPFAVDKILSGEVGRSPVDLIDGYVITRIPPVSGGRWSVYKRDHEGWMIVTSISDRGIRITLRERNMPWDEGLYYLVYKYGWDDDDYQY